jgi:phosphatidylglycerol---prolipoprotein diacylglyceryl transferase
MNPIAFKIFSFPIRWYGVMAALGVCSAYWLIRKNRKYADLSSDQVADLTFLMVVTGVIGARIFYVVQYFDQFRYTYFNGVKVLRSTPAMLWEMLRVDHGGLVFYGGFIVTVIAMIIYCKKKKMDFWKISDILAPGLALGHVFGRIGCFLNGCCYGKPNSWGITYSAKFFPGCKYPGHALHPVQLYEAATNLLLAVVLCFFLKKVKRGQVLAIYIFLYGIIRFCDEFFRGDHSPEDLYFGTFTPAQFIGLFLIPIGIGLFIYFQKKETVMQ